MRLRFPVSISLKTDSFISMILLFCCCCCCLNSFHTAAVSHYVGSLPANLCYAEGDSFLFCFYSSALFYSTLLHTTRRHFNKNVVIFLRFFEAHKNKSYFQKTTKPNYKCDQIRTQHILVLKLKENKNPAQKFFNKSNLCRELL